MNKVSQIKTCSTKPDVNYSLIGLLFCRRRQGSLPRFITLVRSHQSCSLNILLDDFFVAVMFYFPGFLIVSADVAMKKKIIIRKACHFNDSRRTKVAGCNTLNFGGT